MLRPYRKGMRWRRHGSPDGYHWESPELGWSSRLCIDEDSNPLRIDREWKRWSPSVFRATA
jgi:hypothetical protein